jgi:SAM-dependent methyltransferase
MSLDTKDYWEKRLRGEYSLLGVGDIGLGLAYNQWLYRVRRHVFHRIVRWRWRRNAPGRVLDVGSGTGFYVDLWRDLGVREWTGSDLTEVAVEKLAERFSGTGFRQMDISQDLPEEMAPASFEAISVFDVLFHIVDDKKFDHAVKNLAALLVPGGVLLYSDNFTDEKQDIGHQSSRSWSDISAILEKHGLRVRRRFPMFVFMNDPVKTRSRLLRKFFSVITRFVRRGEFCGNAMGALLYLPELLATAVCSSGPSTDILVLEKR